MLCFASAYQPKAQYFCVYKICRLISGPGREVLHLHWSKTTAKYKMSGRDVCVDFSCSVITYTFVFYWKLDRPCPS